MFKEHLGRTVARQRPDPRASREGQINNGCPSNFEYNFCQERPDLTSGIVLKFLQERRSLSEKALSFFAKCPSSEEITSNRESELLFSV